MKKRVASLVLCVLLVMQLCVPAARADEKLYFVAAAHEVQRLSDETMPFWHNGYLYIAASIFSGSVRENLGINHAYVESEKTEVLYAYGNLFLKFDLRKSYAVDHLDQMRHPGGIMRNGQVYVPAAMVAKYFGLEYSVTEVEQGHLVWIRQKDFGLTEREFANAATYTIAQYYATYMKNKTPSAPENVPETPPVSTISGKRIHLCMSAGEDTAAMLDTLDRYGAQAAFFCDAEFLAQQGGLLRRMTAEGHGIGLLVDAKRTDMTVTEQLQDGQRLLKEATCGGTRLVRLENGSEEDRKAVEAAGYRCLEETLDRSDYSLYNTAHAESLQDRLPTQGRSISIWLGENVNHSGLQVFLTLSNEAENRCLAWSETA